MSGRSNAIGRLGEDAAAGYLAARGYEILQRNFRAGRGELDIICRRDGKIYFVEVKTRQQGAPVAPAEAVTADKRRRIFGAATLWLQKNGAGDAPCSFLLLTVQNSHSGAVSIDMVEDFLLW
ncbi:MAG: YraN family protein [Firmicutes bacterium]|nr:YraN family protein [Bacillota bacterium]